MEETSHVEKWEYAMLLVVPWLDGWQYEPLDDRGNRAEWVDVRQGPNLFDPPGLNDFGAKGWEVVGVIPETHLYADDGRSLHSTKTVLLLKRRKPQG
jgi:hypothetical protein